MSKEKTVWDFVEKHYPNYSTSEEIALNNDLKLLMEGMDSEGSGAWKIKEEIEDFIAESFNTKDSSMDDIWQMAVDEEIKNRYNESCKVIYEEAIENYLNESNQKLIQLEQKNALILLKISQQLSER